MATETQSTEKPPSMRQLTEQVAAGVAALVADVEKRNSARATTTSVLRPCTEADALRRCIDALLDLQNAESNSRASSYSNTYGGLMTAGSWPSGDRILRYLAARFGVSLIEIQRPACDRAHVDSLSPDSLLSALRVSAQATR